MDHIEDGSQVRQIVPAIEGETTETRWNADAKCLEHMVKYVQDGEDHMRWFLATELAKLDGAAPKDAPEKSTA